MPYGRYFSVVDDTDQRMPVGMSEVAAVVAYVFIFIILLMASYDFTSICYIQKYVILIEDSV